MTEFHIEVQNEYQIDDAWLASLRAAAQAALVQGNVAPEAQITVLLTEDAVLQRLNRDFRGLDNPTDVLSFASGDPMTPGEAYYLGDIAISVSQAAQQAKCGGHALLAELQLLVVHGVLHLCGHDHADPEDKAVMWQAQATILNSIQAEITAPVVSDESNH